MTHEGPGKNRQVWGSAASFSPRSEAFPMPQLLYLLFSIESSLLFGNWLLGLSFLRFVFYCGPSRFWQLAVQLFKKKARSERGEHVGFFIVKITTDGIRSLTTGCLTRREGIGTIDGMLTLCTYQSTGFYTSLGCAPVNPPIRHLWICVNIYSVAETFGRRCKLC